MPYHVGVQRSSRNSIFPQSSHPISGLHAMPRANPWVELQRDVFQIEMAMTKNGLRVRSLHLLVLLVAIFFARLSHAQDNSTGHEGVNSGDYNIQQTIEFGYRADWIDGNQD